MQTSHLLGWLEILGECDVKSTISDGCIDGFDDVKNDSLLFGAALLADDACVLGISEDTIVVS